MKEILVILPTRERAEKVKAAIEGWENTTTGKSDLMLCLDNDDPQLESYPKDTLVDIDEPIRMCPTVNRTVEKYPGYKYYAFIGDDHIFRTPGWEDIAIKKIEDNGGWGIVYGDDLLQRERLASAAIISANIIDTIGYMALPGLIHLYMDDFWMELGRGIGKLFYTPEIIIEHVHPGAGKAVMDQRYQIVNSGEVYSHDRQVYESWLREKKGEDVAKILRAMNA